MDGFSSQRQASSGRFRGAPRRLRGARVRGRLKYWPACPRIQARGGPDRHIVILGRTVRAPSSARERARNADSGPACEDRFETSTAEHERDNDEHQDEGRGDRGDDAGARPPARAATDWNAGPGGAAEGADGRPSRRRGDGSGRGGSRPRPPRGQGDRIDRARLREQLQRRRPLGHQQRGATASAASSRAAARTRWAPTCPSSATRCASCSPSSRSTARR